MDPAQLLSSAAIATLVSGTVTYVAQRRLLNRKAELDYEANARRRLYEAVGPLRVQLLLAARDVASRIQSHPGTDWNLKPSEYYGRSFIYRLLRPLAIGSLIERQVSFADFSVDSSALELLKFNAVAYRAMTGGDAILNHPEADWSTQSQHVFRENLLSAAATLIAREGNEVIVHDFAQFSTIAEDPSKNPALAPLAALLKRCKSSICENAIFWVRLVAYGYVCLHFVRSHGARLGFAAMEDFALPELLCASRDPYVEKHVHDFPKAFDALLAHGL